MFAKIMVPVDLDHLQDLVRALDVAADLAVHYGAALVYVGVTTTLPGGSGRDTRGYSDKLAAFAEAQALAHGIAASSHAQICRGPMSELDQALLQAVEETEADLVVMASHLPAPADAAWPSNGGKVAARAGVSVMVVRG